MGIIYKILNQINNKVYIGQTCRDLQTRWREHKSRAENKYNTHLYNAIEKYGHENFIIEEIERVEMDRLDEREIYWIAYYDANNPQKGYNLTIGGQGKKNYRTSEIRKLWDEGKSIGEIVELMECDKGTVREALLSHEGYSIHESLSRRKGLYKGVNKYSLEGKLISHYNSILEAANYDKNVASGIGGCCNLKHNQAYGFQWRFDFAPAPGPLKETKFYKRTIAQLDLENNKIQTFLSAADAARAVAPGRNVNSASSQIIQVCKGRRLTAYGYKWIYEEGE